MLMTALMKRLEKVVGSNQLEAFRTAPKEKIAEFLNDIDAEFYRLMVSEHTLLNLQYSVLCAKLLKDYHSSDINDKQFNENILSALMMAELLEHIYHYYLPLPGGHVQRLKKEQNSYRKLLVSRGILNADAFVEENTPAQDTDILQEINDETANKNWKRLTGIRAIRLLKSILPYVKNSHYHKFINVLDKVTSPFIAYLSWIFFAPRLINNVIMLGTYIIPASLTPKQVSLGWQVRAKARLQGATWFEVANDLVWLIAGLLNCFVWLGPHVYIGVYINVVLYGYDVLLAGIRAGVEFNRLNKLYDEYDAIYKEQELLGASTEELNDIRSFQQHLQQRIIYEKNKVIIAVINTTILLIAMAMCLPAIAVVSPTVVLIGSVILLACTLTVYAVSKLLDIKTRPNDQFAVDVEKKFLSSTLTADSMRTEEHSNLITGKPVLSPGTFARLASKFGLYGISFTSSPVEKESASPVVVI